MVCRPSRLVLRRACQSLLGQGTGFAFEQGHIGDQAEGDEVKKGFGSRNSGIGDDVTIPNSRFPIFE